MNSVYINGTGCTKFGISPEADVIDLAVESAQLALEASSLSLAEIDALYVGNMMAYSLENQAHLGAVICGALGVSIPAYRFEAACASSGIAAHAAWKDIAGGHVKNALVLGVEKMTDPFPAQINEALVGATNKQERESGIFFSGLYGMMAQAYLSEYNLSEDILDPGMQLMHQNALGNDLAQFQKSFTLEQIRKSTPIAEPLRLLHCAPLTDGAAAAIFTQTPNDIQISQSLAMSGPPDLSSRTSITELAITQLLIQKLISNQAFSVADIDIFCLHDCFSISLLFALEDLGLAKKGEGYMLLEHILEGSADIIINPWGGLKAFGHPVGATGIRQICTAAETIIKTGKHKALTHNVGGTGGTVCLHLLETA